MGYTPPSCTYATSTIIRMGKLHLVLQQRCHVVLFRTVPGVMLPLGHSKYCGVNWLCTCFDPRLSPCFHISSLCKSQPVVSVHRYMQQGINIENVLEQNILYHIECMRCSRDTGDGSLSIDPHQWYRGQTSGTTPVVPLPHQWYR